MVIKSEMNWIKFLVLLPLSMYEFSGVAGKVFTVFVTSAFIMIGCYLIEITGFVNDHIFSDWEPAKYVAIALFIDGVTGGIKHWQRKTFSASEGFIKFMTKFFITCFGLLLSFSIGGVMGDNTGATYLKTLLYIVAWVYPGLSALANIYIISNKKYPPKWIIDRFTNFYDSGNYEDLKKNK